MKFVGWMRIILAGNYFGFIFAYFILLLFIYIFKVWIEVYIMNKSNKNTDKNIPSNTIFKKQLIYWFNSI